MIKVVIFDLGNVIIPFDFSLCSRKLSEASAWPAEKIFQDSVLNKLVSEYEKGGVSSKEFHGGVCRQLNTEIEYTDFCSMWSEIFTENKDVSAIIRALKGKHRLFLLSNTNELHFKYAVNRFTVLAEFEEYVLSYRLGCAKPDQRIYCEAIRRAGCAPEEIVYIDDIAEYIACAQNLGIQGIHFKSGEQLEQSLSRIIG